MRISITTLLKVKINSMKRERIVMYSDIFYQSNKFLNFPNEIIHQDIIFSHEFGKYLPIPSETYLSHQY